MGGKKMKKKKKNKVPMNKPYNIQNTNICNGIFHISFFKALLINEGETTLGETTPVVNGIRGETTRIHGNQYSILGRLICLPDCDKTSEKGKRKSVVFGINVYLNKFNIKF